MYNQNYENQIFDYFGTINILGSNIKVYNLGAIELYDPKEIIESCNSRKNNVYPLISNNVYEIKVYNNDNNNSIDPKTLVDENGLYQLCLVIDNPRAKKFRERISSGLASLRSNYGMSMENFWNHLYEEVNINEFMACPEAVFESKAPDIINDMLEDYNRREIFVTKVYTFPYFENKSVENEYEELYLNNINKAKLGINVQYNIEFKSLVESLAKLFHVTEKLIIMELGKYEKFTLGPNLEKRFYIKSTDVFDYIKTEIPNKGIKEVTPEKVYFELLKDIFRIYDDKMINILLFNSLTIYKDITHNSSYKILSEFSDEIIKNNQLGFILNESISKAKKFIKDKYL